MAIRYNLPNCKSYVTAMATKDINKNTKTSLMDELKSIKGVLDADDDNVPLLLDDEEVPVLSDAEDDVPLLLDDDDEVPVLTSPAIEANKASLDAAIRQLESMELSPKANKATASKPASLEEKIRANAAPPLIKDDQQTRIRENPFLKKNVNDSFAESRKHAEEALKSVISHSRAISKPARPAPEESRSAMVSVKDSPADGAIDFTDNQFLKSSSAPQSTAPTAAQKQAAPTATTEKDGSENILKLLDEESEVELDIDEGFGELVDIDVDALIAEKTPAVKTPPAKKPVATPPLKNKSTEKELDQLVDEVIDEYMFILEAALKKKLKEKLPDLLKK